MYDARVNDDDGDEDDEHHCRNIETISFVHVTVDDGVIVVQIYW